MRDHTRNTKGMITAITSPDATRSWTYGYDALDRLITADNANGTGDDRAYAYDDADNMVFNSGLCAANPTWRSCTGGHFAPLPSAYFRLPREPHALTPMATPSPMTMTGQGRSFPAASFTTEKAAP